MKSKNKYKEKELPVSETLGIGILLALVGGFLDAYTYLLHGGVFANAQTGNLVLLSMKLAEGELGRAIYYLIPVLAFVLGVLVVAGIKKFVLHFDWIHWQIMLIGIKMLVLFLIGCLPKEVPDAMVNITISFVCAMQVCTFRLLHGSAYATTMCTGNLRSGSDYLFLWLAGREPEAKKKCGQYFTVILSFCAGAASGYWLVRIFDNRSIWAAGLVLFGILLILLTQEKERIQ